jgi:hypothetical protein
MLTTNREDRLPILTVASWWHGASTARTRATRRRDKDNIHSLPPPASSSRVGDAARPVELPGQHTCPRTLDVRTGVLTRATHQPLRHQPHQRLVTLHSPDAQLPVQVYGLRG